MQQIPLQMTQKEKSGLRILKEAVRSVALLFVRLLVFRLFCQLTRTLNIPFIRPFVPLFSRHRFLILHSLSFYFFLDFSDLERTLNLNLGQQEEFSPLQGQCFEYTDRE